jgi:hypothetical protein
MVKSGISRSSVTVSAETAGCHHTCIAVFLGVSEFSLRAFSVKRTGMSFLKRGFNKMWGEPECALSERYWRKTDSNAFELSEASTATFSVEQNPFNRERAHLFIEFVGK